MKTELRTIILCAAVVLSAGCHSFFCVNTLVTDTVTGKPIPSAQATLVLDKGVGETISVRPTAADGTLVMWMNEPTDAWATLTVLKPGYHPWSAQFRGRPRQGLVIRLTPEDKQ